MVVCWSGCAGGNPGGGASITGVVSGFKKGSATGRSNGINSKIPVITACNPKELTVVQLRRERCAHELSKRLSANMVSSREILSCRYGHRKPLPQRSTAK
jgi:hypothetical protein